MVLKKKMTEEENEKYFCIENIKLMTKVFVTLNYSLELVNRDRVGVSITPFITQI